MLCLTSCASHIMPSRLSFQLRGFVTSTLQAQTLRQPFRSLSPAVLCAPLRVRRQPTWPSCRPSPSLCMDGVRRLTLSCDKDQRAKQTQSSSSQLTEATEKPFSELTLGQKVQQAGKDATYTGVIIIGVGITGLMFYAIGRELFSGQSPSGVYSRAVKLCTNNEQVKDAIGEPIKAYGEMNRRGRRRFVKSVEYEVEGVKRMQVQFYLEGSQNKGTVFVEVKQDGRGKYQFEYVLLELDNFPRRIITVEDHR